LIARSEVGSTDSTGIKDSTTTQEQLLGSILKVSSSNSISSSKSRSTVVSLLEDWIGFVDLIVNVLGFEIYFNGLTAPARVSVATGVVKFNTSLNDSRTR